MFGPSVAAWVEKSRNLPTLWINARQVGSFVKIAAVACQGQVVWVALALMLNGDNVLYLQRHLERRLRHKAILAAIPCPIAYESPKLSVH